MRIYTRDEYRADVAAQMLEADLQSKVIALAKGLGFTWYHTHNSRRSPSGYPDLHLIHPDGRSLFRELKQQSKHPTPEQRRWLALLAGAGHDVGVWRPLDYLDGTVERELANAVRGRRPS